MENQYYYETEVEWIDGRGGELRAPDLPTLEVSPPPEFQGNECTVRGRLSTCMSGR
jgi:hypothetical protein